MSDKGLQTRNSLLTTSAIFGVSSITGLITGILKWFSSGISGFGLIGILALIILATNYIFKAYRAYGDVEYSKANQNGLLASLSSLGAAVLAFIF